MSTAHLLTRPQTVLADAVVAHATLEGATANGRQVVALTLLVVGADQTTEPVSVQVSVAPTDLSRIHPGASLTTRLDPSRPTQLSLPWFLTAAH